MNTDPEKMERMRRVCEEMRKVCADIRRHNALMDVAASGLRHKTDRLLDWLMSQKPLHQNDPGVSGASAKQGVSRLSGDDRSK